MTITAELLLMVEDPASSADCSVVTWYFYYMTKWQYSV